MAVEMLAMAGVPPPGTAPPTGATLPATGSDSFPLAGVGIAALAIGGLVLVGARLRSKSASI